MDFTFRRLSDKQREVDFVLPRGLMAFRENYPQGRNYLLSPGVRHRSVRRVGDLEVVLIPIGALREEMAPSLS